MHLPDWMARLLRENAVRLDDRDYERDEAAINAMLAPYRGRRYLQRPPDPRVLDVVRLAALRDRLLDAYAYRWRQVEAVDEIIDALFAPVIQSDGTRFALGVSSIHLNDKGHSPDPRHRHDLNEFQRYYYITARSLRLGAFLTSYEEAVRLLGNVLPNWGFVARVTPANDTQIRLEQGRDYGAWISGSSIATLIVAAMLDLLANRPGEAAPWRAF
jgi:hypothetical protein